MGITCIHSVPKGWDEKVGYWKLRGYGAADLDRGFEALAEALFPFRQYSEELARVIMTDLYL